MDKIGEMEMDKLRWIEDRRTLEEITGVMLADEMHALGETYDSDKSNKHLSNADKRRHVADEALALNERYVQDVEKICFISIDSAIIYSRQGKI